MRESELKGQLADFQGVFRDLQHVGLLYNRFNHLRAGIHKSPKIQIHSGLPRIHGFDGMTNFKSGYNAGVSFFKKSLSILCTQGQGHTHTIWVHSFIFCSPDFLRKTGRGRLVTREAQRTVSLSTLLYFGLSSQLRPLRPWENKHCLSAGLG